MKRLLLIILFPFIYSFGIMAQLITDPEEMFMEGEFFFLAEEYQEAVYYYKQLVEKYPENANFNYKVGMTYLQLQGQEHLAIPYLEKAITQTTSKYKKRSFTEKNAPHYALFYLGNAYRINNELDKALSIYEEFTSSEDFEGNYNLDIVEAEIKACERAKIIRDVPVNMRQTKLDSPINSAENNFNPMISGDGNTMVFVTQLKFYDAIHLSRKVGGRWTEPEVLNPQVGSDGDLYPTSLSYNGNELYMVKRQEGNYDLYVSYLPGPFWTKAVPLNSPVNSRSHETHASVSKDGKTLYFTSDRKGGEGKLDIYSAEIQENLEWDNVQNLGNRINTPEDEETPFINRDGTRLFFSSKGHFNMGGYDIFYCDLRDDGTWSDAVNIGFPINTTGDDLFYYPIDNSKTAYYARLTKEDPIISDIYFIEVLGRGQRSDQDRHALFGHDFELKVIDVHTSDTLIIHFYRETNDFTVVQPTGEYIIELK